MIMQIEQKTHIRFSPCFISYLMMQVLNGRKNVYSGVVSQLNF